MASDAPTRAARHTPVRTCVACRQTGDKRTLIRLVRSPQGEVLVDTTGRAHGRGAYLHSVAACIDAARKRKALERSLRVPVPDTVWAGLAALAEGSTPAAGAELSGPPTLPSPSEGEGN